MSELSSQAVETEPLGRPSPGDVETAVRVGRVWPRRVSRGWRYAYLRRMLALADLAAALLAGLTLTVLGGDGAQLAWSVVLLPMWIVVAKLLGLYDRDEAELRHLTTDEAPQLVLWALVGTSVSSVMIELTPAGRPVLASAFSAGVVAALSVFFLRAAVRWSWRQSTQPERVMFVGTAETERAFRRKLELFPELHMSVIAAYDSSAIGSVDQRWLGTTERLVFAPASLDGRKVGGILAQCRSAGTALSVIPPARDAFGPSAKLTHLVDVPLLQYRTADVSRSTLFLKRVLDIGVSAMALVLAFPLLALIAGAIKLESRGPAIFAQLRAGVSGRPFRMLKFRSMVEDAEARLPALVPFDELAEPMFKLHDDPRVTRVGRVLRRWSLDELPQLWNVLVGDMSLVGPRPEQLDLVERYSPGERLRLAVKPGLTGPMQVYGRGQLTFAERLAVERDYVENVTVVTDLRILAMTIVSVLNGRGAY